MTNKKLREVVDKIGHEPIEAALIRTWNEAVEAAMKGVQECKPVGKSLEAHDDMKGWILHDLFLLKAGDAQKDGGND